MKQFRMFCCLLLVSALVAPAFARGGHEALAAAKDSGLKGFSRIEVGAGIKVDIKQDAAFSVKATGPAGAVANLDMRVHGDNLRIGYKRPHFGPAPTVAITLPVLLAINLSGGSVAALDFDATKSPLVKLDLSGGSRVEGLLLADKLVAEISGGSRIEVEGYGNEFLADLSGGSAFECKDWACDKAVVKLSGGSSARLAVQSDLVVNASGGSWVDYLGKPKLITDLSGGSRVQGEK
jgi:hypothetical protein